MQCRICEIGIRAAYIYFSKIGKTVIVIYIRKSRAVVKRRAADGSDAVGNGDARQSIAVVKRQAADGSDAVGYGYEMCIRDRLKTAADTVCRELNEAPSPKKSVRELLQKNQQRVKPSNRNKQWEQEL